jgi:hypothetical protein
MQVTLVQTPDPTRKIASTTQLRFCAKFCFILFLCSTKSYTKKYVAGCRLQVVGCCVQHVRPVRRTWPHPTPPQSLNHKLNSRSSDNSNQPNLQQLDPLFVWSARNKRRQTKRKLETRFKLKKPDWKPREPVLGTNFGPIPSSDLCTTTGRRLRP